MKITGQYNKNDLRKLMRNDNGKNGINNVMVTNNMITRKKKLYIFH